jgi:hypothetical protein
LLASEWARARPLALTAASWVVGVFALAHARVHTELLHLTIDIKQGLGMEG